jgi:hypothetical protein
MKPGHLRNFRYPGSGRDLPRLTHVLMEAAQGEMNGNGGDPPPHKEWSYESWPFTNGRMTSKKADGMEPRQPTYS